MRTFRWNAPIMGAGALVLCVLTPALFPLKAEDLKTEVVVPVQQAAASMTAVSPLVPTRRQNRASGHSLSELKSNLNRSDKAVALKALHMAVSELGDGVTLVWERRASGLKGRIKPVAAYRDGQGRLCRTVLYALARGDKTNEIEIGVCRSLNGRWLIEG
ncbi:MAG: hypothetical protein AAF405_00135 [Pseudomonadota bacterium]